MVRTLTEDDRPFSLCPPDRESSQIVSNSRMAEEGTPYRGPGPHRLIVDGPSDATGGLPASWVPARASGAYQVEDLQLVVCEYQYAVGSKGPLQTCGFRPVGGGPVHTLTAQSATYDYKVYEVTSGRQVTSFTLEAVAKPFANSR
ncbi:hypothetical protein [Kribbella sp. CA-294648]|uniref:hypothetical protein n=1 Tax=Kribbella sp. CA-294648 TaxID=3239948 RepID=UPI003D8C0E2A